MAFSTSSVSVGTGATPLVNPTTGSISDPVPVVLFNNDAAATLFIGGPNVTTGNGFPILFKTGISFRLMASDPVFGIVAAGTLDCRVMIGRQ
jgi:hypothetical protein